MCAPGQQRSLNSLFAFSAFYWSAFYRSGGLCRHCRFAVICGMTAVTWFDGSTNQRHSALSIPHFTFRNSAFYPLPSSAAVAAAASSSFEPHVQRRGVAASDDTWRIMACAIPGPTATRCCSCSLGVLPYDRI